MWMTLTSPESTTLLEWKESVKLATPRPSSKRQKRDYRAEVTDSTTAQARDPQLTTASVRKLTVTTDLPHPTGTTFTASNQDRVTVGKTRFADLDNKTIDTVQDKDDSTIDDNVKLCTLVTNTNIKGESPC